MRVRSLFKRHELIYIVALIVVSLAIWFNLSFKEKGATAIVEKNGVAIDKILLTDCTERIYDGVKIIFGTDGVKIIDSPCLDKICVNTGLISRNGEAIVCLPMKISIRLSGGEGFDSVTY